MPHSMQRRVSGLASIFPAPLPSQHLASGNG
jgi:hypothetical protein